MNDLILGYLVQFADFRERRNKNRWIGGIIFKKYGIEITPKIKDQLADIVTDMQNADRYWRMHTAERPQLRGSDWDTGRVVEQKKQLELGYAPGHNQDIHLSTR